PDFLAVGDFDADGDLDAVAAARGGNRLQLFEGDGRGALASSQFRELPGSITALAAGEINRPDGLVDLVIGIRSPDGPRLWILEGPNGALRSEAEVVSIGAPAEALALGQFDGDYTRELVASAGNELVIVRGRDRRLVALDPVTDPPPVERLTLTEPAVGLAVGSFADDGGPAIALLSASGGVKLFLRRDGAEDSWTTLQEGRSEITGAAVRPFLVAGRVTGSAAPDLMVVDGANRQLRILSVPSGDRAGRVVELALGGAPAAMLPMRLNADALADLVIGGESGLATATTAVLATI